MALPSNFFSTIYIPALLSALLRSKVPTLHETTNYLEEYDYIVVGSGIGGSVVANRLSEDPKITVLLLEAGKMDNVSTEVPTMTIALLGGGYDWSYVMEPQENVCLGMKNKSCLAPNGKVIGGSTAINFMQHLRGSKLDYDDWSDLNNTGWSYEEVLPYFKKSENRLVNGACTEDRYTGCGGELPVSNLPNGTERKTAAYFIKGVQELGYETNILNSEKQIGVDRGVYTMKNSVRTTAATAFLRSVKDRKNLHIVLDAFVNKVLVDPDTKKAIGVEFEREGVVKQIKVRKEVILSAGAYSSPKILMLSGIGPKEELEKFKIPVIHELPGVGQNLEELVGAPVVAVTGKDLPEGELNLIDPPTIRGWQKGTGGLMASSTGFDATWFAKSKYETRDRADLIIFLSTMPLYGIIQSYLQKGLGYNDEIWGEYFAHFADKELVSFFPAILHPKSRGYVTIRSSDPKDRPVIDPKMLSEEQDANKLLEGIKLVHKLMNTSQFVEKGFKIAPNVLSACKEHEFFSDEYSKCHIKQLGLSVWGSCCTNKMGPDTDKMAVVDPRLRVYGISGLRVVDASAMPSGVSSYMSATVYMVAEKAAAMIKEDNA